MVNIKIDTSDMDSKLASLADEAAAINHNRGFTNREITSSINKGMKAAGKYSKWKFSRVGTFIAISAKDDVKVSEAYYCMKWFQANFPSLIGNNMAPVIADNMDGVTIINFSAC